MNGQRLPIEEKIRRLEALQRGAEAGTSVSQTARDLSMSPKTLFKFISDHAADGIDPALAHFRKELGR